MLSLVTVAIGLGLALLAGAAAVSRVDALDARATLIVAAVLLAAGGVTAQGASLAPATPSATAEGDGVAAAPTDGGAVDAGDDADRRAAAATTNATVLTAAPATNATATVVAVSAGDRLTYRTADGTRRQVRLVGVGAPGVDGADPARFDGVVTGDRGRECLSAQGHRALVSLRTRLVGESVTVRSVATERGTAAAVLHVDGRSLNRQLVARGNARATDGRYADAERGARSADRGVWSCTVVEPERPLREAEESAFRIAAVHPNPPGDDGAALTEERVVIENSGRETVDLSDWYLVDGDGKAYFFFGGAQLRPGETLVLHVGAGRNREGHVYWGATAPVLDNDHETLTLVDGDADRVVRLSY